MQKDSVVIRDAASGKWRCYRSPVQILIAERRDAVLPLLQRLQEEVFRRGLHAAGFLSYEAAAVFDPAMRVHHAPSFPLAWFGLYRNSEDIVLPEPDDGSFSVGHFKPGVSGEEYRRALERIKAYIRAGDTYQVNYTLRLRGAFAGDPWNLFLSMIRAQPAGYGAFIDTGETAVCSASPELFFRLKNGRIECKPMKGTVKRGRTPEEDRTLSRWLRSSEKNRAENLMIVDMIRNDVGRVADIGSVCVPALFEVERHPTLWQMTSSVNAECRRPLLEILAALFPCASITGAPKIRTMEIIHELEPDPRRLYTGSIGFVTPDRGTQFNVAIRTACVNVREGSVEYGSGGGIVADSILEEEYSEALLKSRILTGPPPEFSLLESLLWMPGDGYFLLDRHMTRLSDSAAYFDYAFDRALLEERMKRMEGGFSERAQKVRVLLDRNGELTIESEAIDVSGEGHEVTVRLAEEPVQSSDVFLFHKTTHRMTYERVRARHPGYGDVLLHNEHGELTESCVANIVLDIDGRRCTPPVKSGLLAGVFRAWLLERGTIEEKTLYIDDLKRCRAIYLINSVRRWQRARLDESR